MNNKKKAGYLLLGATLIFVLIVLSIVFFGKEKSKQEIVGMVMTGSKAEAGWNGYHYAGIKAAAEEQNIKLIVKENIIEGTGKSKEAVQQLVDAGAKLIILSSYNYEAEVKDIIDAHPEISFYCCSSDTVGTASSTYFVRMYQARYLAGIVAGMQTKTGKIGYVAAMSNSEVNRGINAFTLGVQSVNPEATVYVTWTNSWDNEEKERQATRDLVENVGVDVVDYHQNQAYVIDEAEKLGIYSIGCYEKLDGYSDKYLTAAIGNWDKVYAEILKEHMQGRGNSTQVIWAGIETEAVGLAPFSSEVSEETVDVVEKAKTRMQNGWNVFSDEIYAQDGTVICKNGETISDDILLGHIDWLIKGVEVYEK